MFLLMQDRRRFAGRFAACVRIFEGESDGDRTGEAMREPGVEEERHREGTTGLYPPTARRTLSLLQGF